MSNETFNFEEYEIKLFALLIRDRDFFEKNGEIVKAGYFSIRFAKEIYPKVKRWWEKYEEPLALEDAKIQVGFIFEALHIKDSNIETYHEFLDRVYAVDVGTGKQAVEDYLISWIKHRLSTDWAYEMVQGGELGHDPGEYLEKYQEICNFRKTTQDRKLLTVEEFMALEIEKRAVIVNPWLLEKSIGMVAAWRGAGKTWWLVSLLDSITKGLVFGPWEVATPVPCLYIDGELSADELQERFQLLPYQSKPRKAPLYLYNDELEKQKGNPKASLMDAEWRNWLKDKVAKEGIKIVVIDNLSSLSSGSNPYDENTKKDWEPINSWLIDLKHQGCSSIICHHTGYSGTQRGTTGREDNMNYSIMLKQPEGWRADMGCRFTLQFKKARVRPQDYPLVQPYDFQLIDADGKMDWQWEARKKDQKAEILRMLDTGVKQTDIAKALGITASAVSQAKARALAHQEIGEDGKLTDLGKEIVEKAIDMNDLGKEE